MADVDTAEKDADNIIRIMVATDNHLGYAEKDTVRGEDSFTAFEEILELAVSEDVDMILLGGDLFHDSVPSQNSMYKCIELLRRYTFGDKPVSLEILSDQSHCFHNAVNQSVNYEDPNLNISIPVFSIHGNHDDPSGFGRLSSLDLLSSTGLVNYFGRWTDLTQLEISPILMRKGETKLALYGLSHIHDARLVRIFTDFQVTINCPKESEEDWFHLMVVHQNRADRGPKNYLPEELLPAFLNLIIWGHEHDCRIDPEVNALRDFYVSQPGSSVATSLAKGESIKKHVGLLEIYKTKFHLKPLPLQTVRPFIFDSIDIDSIATKLNLKQGDASIKVCDFAKNRVEAMIEEAKSLLTGHPKQPTLPLIRLRLRYTDETHMFNTIRFGQMFSTRVANVADVVKFEKLTKRANKDKINVDRDAMQRVMEVDNTARVEELVDRYFEEVKDKNPLKLLHSKALAEVTYRMVERSDNNAADHIFKFYNEKAVEHLMETLPSIENINDELENFRLRYKADDLLKMLDASDLKTGAYASTAGSKTINKDANSSLAPKPSTAKASGRGASRVGAARGRGTAASTSVATTPAKPKLNVSVNTRNSSNEPQGLMDAYNKGRRNKGKVVYVVSDDSD
ncbi:double-strand break repair protein MRE11 [Drosophila novamexicana]|uniref:double-strand break repair protein MRE11 n=1 Tax=Drosophila novamexicana TaxID=47314 RepID=UPI0011E5955C|nr:double-strand break repair protein MRE11 [Drosophila novamexicana]XP_030555185.1 double-strand break repair protein MRE11 [Drosophila novamexicana]